MALEPGELYELHLEVPELDDLGEPVLVHAMDGYVDAGSGVRLAVEHLLGTLAAHRGGDVRRGPTGRLPLAAAAVHLRPQPLHRLRRAADRHPAVVTDSAGTPFLLLTGPEPDVQWERFVEAVGQLADRFAVRLTVGMLAIPMGVPHTRPTGMSLHATRPELLTERQEWIGTIQVPGNVAALLEYRFGQHGRDCLGFAAHVPHYLTRTDYPETSRQLLQAVADATGLVLPTAGLDAAAAEVREQLAVQIAENGQVAEVVKALEDQYDAFVSATGRGLLADSAPLPTADELGAQFEAFLADQDPGQR